LKSPLPPVERRVHLAHGLRIRSEPLLCGLPQARDAVGHDVDLRWQSSGAVPVVPPVGESLLCLELRGATRYAAAFDGRVYRLRFPGCCEFTIDANRRTVECGRDPSADPELVSILAAGALTSFLLTLAGATVLHASAVEIGDAAVGIFGASGFGKSTVAALLCAGGCNLVTDDVLRVEVSDDVLVYAGADEVRLRPTVRALADSFPHGVPSRDTADGRLALRPQHTTRARLPLAALAIPRAARAGDDVSVRRLSRAQALVSLLAFPRLLGWTSKVFLRQQFEGLANLVERVPLLEVRVPCGPPFSAEMGRHLRAAMLADIRSDYAGIAAPK
jgi:hypothetical protein